MGAVSRSDLQAVLDELRGELPALERDRSSSAYQNDMFEAVDDWCHLCQRAIDSDTKVDFPKRAGEEMPLLNTLNSTLSAQGTEQAPCFAHILELSRRALLLLAEFKPPEDGHLGVLRIIRDQFSFLSQEFHFRVVAEEPAGVRFSSGQTWIELSAAAMSSLSCSFGPEPPGSGTYWLEDLLYAYGDERFRAIPMQLAIPSTTEVESWFAFVASVFRRYGAELLADRPGIFDRLREAQSVRDAEYTQEMDRKHGDETAR
jgi:hypothetical protein